MKLKTCFVYLLIFLTSVTGFLITVKAQTAKNRTSEKSVVKKLRDSYSMRDFEACAKIGQNFSAKISANVEAKAWTIACQSRIAEQREDALKAAQKLADERGENAWSWFALANAQLSSQKSKDALDSIEKSLAIEPDNEEFIFTKSQALSAQKRYDEAGIYLEKNSAKLNDKSRIAYLQALILYNRSKISVDKIDEPMRKQSFDKFAEAVKIAPQLVNANYLYGTYLNIDKRYAEAYPLLKKAVALSPKVLEIHREFWKSASNQSNKTDGQKNAEIVADLNIFLTARKNSPYALFVVSQKYGEMKNAERQLFYENQILKNYDDTKYAEEVFYSRIHIFEIEKAGKPESRDALIGMYREYVERPKHFDENKLGDIYYTLLQYLKYDKNVTDEEFTKAINGALKYRVSEPIRYGINEIGFFRASGFANVNSDAALAIQTRSSLYPDSSLNKDTEKYARAGIVEAENNYKKSSPSLKIFRNAQALNTLGYILTKEGKLDEAERILLDAKQILDPKSTIPPIIETSELNNYYLAQLYTAKKDYDKAEEYYLIDAHDNQADRKIFAKFYEEKTGKKEGFEEYYAEIKSKMKVAGRKRIVASRIENPKDAAPFSLKTTDDKAISLADLKGKIVVVNVWGTWCAPCVGEMPQLQQLYKQYENDKDVAIITMDTSDELETVRKFIADKKYEFPVLIGDSYVSNIFFDNSVAFPTTLFVDKKGKVSFIKVGGSDNLLEEFGWRIEALK
ncbi:MAG: redoxin domain-containing protein [Pyrinomonadaceae bacterium]